MYLLGLALLILALKYFEIGPVATWSWWWVLAPFAATALWWAWADSTGYTKRKAMEKMDQRKKDRINKHKEALGIRPRKPRGHRRWPRCKGLMVVGAMSLFSSSIQQKARSTSRTAGFLL